MSLLPPSAYTIIFRGVGTHGPKPINLEKRSSPPPPIQCWHPIFSDLMRNSIRIRKPTLIGEGGGEGYCLEKEVSIELRFKTTGVPASFENDCLKCIYSPLKNKRFYPAFFWQINIALSLPYLLNCNSIT